MFDAVLRKRIDPALNVLAGGLKRGGIGANAVTATGLGVGFLACAAIFWEDFLLALLLILLSRLADGLDGALARLTRKSDLGGYLDIVCDFIFYGAVPLAFVILDPAANGLAGAVLIASFYANGASVLAFAIMQEKRKIPESVRGPKSFFFSTGLAEAGETLATFCLFCLFPGRFAWIAYAFAVICAYTTISRIWQASRLFD